MQFPKKQLALPIKVKKKKKVSVSRLIERADEAFSKYVRLRDCIRTLWSTEEWLCITCWARVFLKEADAGHFQLRSRKIVRWHAKNVHMQCTLCNRWRYGEQHKHGKKIDQLYWNGMADILEDMGTAPFKLSPFTLVPVDLGISIPLEEIEEYYKKKTAELSLVNATF